MTYSEISILLLVLILVPGIVAQIRVTSAIKKYSQVRSRGGKTGAAVAAEIMQDAGIYDVTIQQANSFLGDHYDPTKKTLVLSPNVYDSDSVAAIGIAAHEAGHALATQACLCAVAGADGGGAGDDVCVAIVAADG